MREAQIKKYPYNLILGDNEKNDKTISYRLYGKQDTTTLKQAEFLKQLEKEIKEKTLR